MRYSFTLHVIRTKAVEGAESLSENFEIELLEALIPPPVENINVIPQNSTSNDVIVTLTLPRDLQKVSNHLKYSIMIKAQDENDTQWIESEFRGLEKKNNLIEIQFRDLKYAYTTYQFKVRVKSKSSRDEDKMWSIYRETTFTTNPQLPEKTPIICQNCYNIMDNGNIFIYWLEVDKFHRNGKNFGYDVRIKNLEGREVDRGHHKKSYFMLKSPQNKTFTVDIYSVNHIGTSVRHSRLHVVNTERRKSLVKIKKELFSDYGYKLSWKLRDSNDLIEIESFTILWCQQRNELPNQCDSPIKYKILPQNQKEFFVNTTKTFQFGIAINRADGLATGFEWAECTASRPDGNNKKEIILI